MDDNIRIKSVLYVEGDEIQEISGNGTLVANKKDQGIVDVNIHKKTVSFPPTWVKPISKEEST